MKTDLRSLYDPYAFVDPKTMPINLCILFHSDYIYICIYLCCLLYGNPSSQIVISNVHNCLEFCYSYTPSLCVSVSVSLCANLMVFLKTHLCQHPLCQQWACWPTHLEAEMCQSHSFLFKSNASSLLRLSDADRKLLLSGLSRFDASGNIPGNRQRRCS